MYFPQNFLRDTVSVHTDAVLGNCETKCVKGKIYKTTVVAVNSN